MDKGSLIWRTSITVEVMPEFEKDMGVKSAEKMLQGMLVNIAGQYSKGFMFIRTGEDRPVMTGGCVLCGGLGFVLEDDGSDTPNAIPCSCVREVKDE